MSDLYRIKPLVFKAITGEHFRAESKVSHGDYRIVFDSFGWWVIYPNTSSTQEDSLQEAENKANDHYRAYIVQALEAVE